MIALIQRCTSIIGWCDDLSRIFQCATNSCLCDEMICWLCRRKNLPLLEVLLAHFRIWNDMIVRCWLHLSWVLDKVLVLQAYVVAIVCVLMSCGLIGRIMAIFTFGQESNSDAIMRVANEPFLGVSSVIVCRYISCVDIAAGVAILEHIASLKIVWNTNVKLTATCRLHFALSESNFLSHANCLCACNSSTRLLVWCATIVHGMMSKACIRWVTSYVILHNCRGVSSALVCARHTLWK